MAVCKLTDIVYRELTIVRWAEKRLASSSYELARADWSKPVLSKARCIVAAVFFALFKRLSPIDEEYKGWKRE
ncbi:MAG: hypothetical protein Rhob2KO_09160 [Rhodopirellula baltica]